MAHKDFITRLKARAFTEPDTDNIGNYEYKRSNTSRLRKEAFSENFVLKLEGGKYL